MRQTDRRQTKASLNASTLWGLRHNNVRALKTIRLSNVTIFLICVVRQ